MINAIWEVLKVVAAILPIVGLCLLLKRNNFEKVNRHKQFCMPAFALLFCFILMIMMHKFTLLIYNLIRGLQEQLKELASASWWPNGLGTFIRNMVYLFNSFIDSINLDLWICFIANFAILIVYIIYKKICLSLFKRTFDKTSLYQEDGVKRWIFGELYDKVSNEFYEYSYENGIWCLQEKRYQTRGLLCAFFYGSIVISSLLMLISSRLYNSKSVAGVFYPIFGIILISEIYFYLDGLTLPEYNNLVRGEKEDSVHRVNYSLMRKFLRNIFGDRLNAENTMVNSEIFYNVTSEEIINSLGKSEDPSIVAFSTYLKNINQEGVKLNHSYIYSTLELLKGKNILFNNPFYNDLIPYAFYPMNRILLQHKKVLVILGRHAIEDDITAWLKNGIESVTNIPSMWNIEILGKEEKTNTDIGIVTRSDIMNIALHEKNKQFLSDVGYCVIIEPSKIISTAQMGLNLLIKECKKDNTDNIVFCMCDKNCDGLVDSLSHVLMTNITEVTATEKHFGTSSYMLWNVDGEYLNSRITPNISRYLGVGTELSFAALKNQVAKTQWYGGETFPVIDINWIARQYYFDLLKYADLPTNQECMDKVFVTSAGTWNAKMDENNYFVVEDEFYNMFEIVRDFSTRSKNQGFINVLSSEYMLKDYMINNASVFETDSKAIPYIVADYARTRRNITLRILMMMSSMDVNEDILVKEFSLLGLNMFDIQKQLWYEIYMCFAKATEVSKIMNKDYKEAVSEIYYCNIEYDGITIDKDIITTVERFNFDKGDYEKIYKLNGKLETKIIDAIQSAEFITEDENGGQDYLGAELRGHIYQKYLPGQFFTFGGKYYEMQYITADGKVLVRRAADHISNRKYYRQIRAYNLTGFRLSNQIGSKKNISGLKLTKEYVDICVSTDGYLSMNKYNDIAGAKKVLFEGDTSSIPDRIYNNKEVLKIELPQFDDNALDKIRYTLTVMLNELFKTLFAENQSYIVAVTDEKGLSEGEMKPLTYSVKSEKEEFSKDSIYIIEDSQIDLGLTIAVERNIHRILEMIQDYLDWHMELMENSLNSKDNKTIDKKQNNTETDIENNGLTDENEKNRKKGLWTKIKEFFKKMFCRNEKESSVTSEIEKEESNQREESQRKELFKKIPYHERYYMMFGMKGEPSSLDLVGTGKYLSKLLNGNDNALKQVREGREIAKYIEKNFRPDKSNSRYCDFCGTEILGVEYDTLIDGRCRCVTCSKTAVKTEEEFKTLFVDVCRNMESFFGIKILAGINVEMVNAKRLHKALGMTFTPQGKNNGRVLGVAIKSDNGFKLLIENGSPRIKSIMTMAHELTHIWQYQNWNARQIRKTYGKKLELEIYEGMAKWVEIQYAYLINEHAVAKREEIITAYRQDEYGRGFLRYRSNYMLTTENVITGTTPFYNKKFPLGLEYVNEVYMPIEFLNLPENVEEEENNNDIVEVGYDFEKKRRAHSMGQKTRNSETLQYYFYNQFTEEEKKVYDRLVEAIKNFETDMHIEPTVSNKTLLKISHAVLQDHPELYWFQYGLSYYGEISDKASKYSLEYCMDKTEMEHRQEMIDAVEKTFLKNVTNEISDYEAVLTIYRNIIDLVDYDSISLEKQEEKGRLTSEQRDDLRSIYGTMVNKKAVCAGYAKTFQYLLQRIGIECLYISGNCKGEPHAWNVVKLEGNYYHVDVTWGDYSNTKEKLNTSDEIYYDYFCVTTEEILLDHQPNVEEFSIPICEATECNYYVKNDLYMEEYNLQKIKEMALYAVASKEKSITFKFADSKVCKKAKKELVDEQKWYEILQYVNFKLGKKVDSSTYTYSDYHMSKGILRFNIKHM